MIKKNTIYSRKWQRIRRQLSLQQTKNFKNFASSSLPLSEVLGVKAIWPYIPLCKKLSDPDTLNHKQSDNRGASFMSLQGTLTCTDPPAPPSCLGIQSIVFTFANGFNFHWPPFPFLKYAILFHVHYTCTDMHTKP